MNLESVGTPVLWIGFTAFVVAMLVLDLSVFHRRAHEVRMREALIWTGVWIGMALFFNLGVYLWFGAKTGLEFLTGYLIEKALSVDNIFVFLVIFAYFRVPGTPQGYRFKPGHPAASMTCREGLTALPGHRQLVDL
jgi:tellurite resistance protein TerC